MNRKTPSPPPQLQNYPSRVLCRFLASLGGGVGSECVNCEEIVNQLVALVLFSTWLCCLVSFFVFYYLQSLPATSTYQGLRRCRIFRSSIYGCFLFLMTGLWKELSCFLVQFACALMSCEKVWFIISAVTNIISYHL